MRPSCKKPYLYLRGKRGWTSITSIWIKTHINFWTFWSARTLMQRRKWFIFKTNPLLQVSNFSLSFPREKSNLYSQRSELEYRKLTKKWAWVPRQRNFEKVLSLSLQLGVWCKDKFEKFVNWNLFYDIYPLG